MKFLTGLMMMAAMTLTFSACGDDDDSSKKDNQETNEAGNNGNGGNGGGGRTDTGVFKGAKRVFGDNLVKAYGREGYDRYTVTYDDYGYVTKVHRDRYSNGSVDRTEDYVITYGENVITVATSKNGTPRGNMIVNIGSNGFVSKVQGEALVQYSYDSDGHLTTMSYTESGSTEKMELVWQNGDLYAGGWDGERVTVVYTDQNHRTPINNVAGYIEFDHVMGIDMDDDIAFISGAMGFGPKHLPLAWSGGKSQENATVAWTLDAAGRATKAVVTETNNYGNTTTSSYFWEY